jgi:cytochrome c biogenesis protein CcmG, thiol:disulfide interchange protein DsbE
MRGSRDWVLVATAVIAIAVWFAMRSSERAEVAPAARPEATKAVAGDSASVSTRAPAPIEGALALDVALETLDGDAVSLSDYGGQVVLVNFWASWCGPCRVEIPELKGLYEDLSEEGFEILAVNVGEGADEIGAFTESIEMPFAILLDSDGAAARRYGIRGLPTSFLVDREGVVRLVHVGIATDSMLRQHIRELLGETE